MKPTTPGRAVPVLLPLLALVLLAAAACGGDIADDSGRDITPLLTAVTTAGAGEAAVLEGTPLVALRTLPAAAVSAEMLSPAGRAQADGGGTIDLARACVEGVAAWEYVSAADDGWRVWQPAVLDDALADAGAGALIIDVTEEDWPDSCLGLARQDEVCLTVITPGYRVIIEQGGNRIEYHAARGPAARTGGIRRAANAQGD